jgi:endonuclease YncB( thermonuclease family)
MLQRIIAILCSVWLAAPVFAADHVLTGTARVTDGDTLNLRGTRVRLLHIDAPETAQTCGRRPCGTDATRHLAGLMHGASVTCSGDRFDTYGRLLAVCTTGGQDLNRQMVRDGHAMVFRRYGDTYDRDEAEARNARRGLWRATDPTPPWDFRAQQWQASTQTSPQEGCPIKGNISASGERIYHTPYSRWYDRTRIATGKGERWFCSETEALVAGWRAARGS